jgi:hypothetical protein
MPEMQTVQVVMLEPLMERCRDYLRVQGWDLVRAPQLEDADETDPIPTYLAVIPPGSPLEKRLKGAGSAKDS